MVGFRKGVIKCGAGSKTLRFVAARDLVLDPESLRSEDEDEHEGRLASCLDLPQAPTPKGEWRLVKRSFPFSGGDAAAFVAAPAIDELAAWLVETGVFAALFYGAWFVPAGSVGKGVGGDRVQ